MQIYIHFFPSFTDICYFHSRILFWKEKEKTRKVANLHKYHPGMTELEYLAYWLLTLLPQVEPGFNIRDYTRDPYKKLGVKVTDVKLRKKTKIHGMMELRTLKWERQ